MFGAYGYNLAGVYGQTGDTEGFVEKLGLGTSGSGEAEPDLMGKSIRENQVACPSDMVAFADATFRLVQYVAPVFSPGKPAGMSDFGMSFGWPTSLNEILRGLPADSPNAQAYPRRHGGRWNVGFCDTHVENLRAKALFDVSNPDTARRWNNDHQPHTDLIPPPP